ncbi:5'-3' exoribonuclease 2-like [Actinia tenebrosa]|uniref:5'-3' exoribonuclease n=1 Tax=Actinia tenebrosa TaxID=6105 RepID=A0A6P8IZS9_ACTTE|nr:5'-3' exoribonuclease 2-like [Actinia tenebrosa]
MGVPAFFRWLSRKYPSIVVHCVEEKAKEVDGVKFPVDTSGPNPNDYEFDNLYLDMNGIIHPCCHPENKPAPKNEDEMMLAIFEYIDRIFAIVRPRKLLYMAIDGVAPRAKMNQQRSRRFRASKESREKSEEMAKIRSELAAKGALLPPEKDKTEHFDSNCITPGTEFMANLSVCLGYYITDRLNNDPGWKNIKVILSDANVPGEGEHKIMDFIRKQRASPGHDPNTKHCLNGADADLIMLGLATHEPHFTIIREEFKPNQKRPCELCGQVGHEMAECTGLPKEKQGEFDELSKPVSQEVEFIFIRINVLREYLERDLRLENLPFAYDFERCVDDWVFMCFFVGNDFLPHLPSLEIREGAIDRLVKFYKNVVPRCGGYITKDGFVDLNKVQLVLQELGYVEDEIFKKRQQDNIAFKQRLKAKKDREKRQKMNGNPLWTPDGQFSPHALGFGTIPGAISSPRQQAFDMRRQGMNYTQDRANHTAAADLRSMLTKGEETKGEASSSSSQDNPSTSAQSNKRKLEDDDEEKDPPDNIRLWEDGWKERYYTNKFGVSEADESYEDFRTKVADAYVEGLCWVLQYYYQGCPSWKWYYPYHYAPFASDFRDIGRLKSTFERGTKPFKPLEQLMGVFPAASGNFLPPTWRNLMSNPESPIIDFYPIDFQIDLNGKKYAWQGVALLPFVDEKRLLDALAKVYPDITEQEAKRNSLGKDRLYLRQGNPAFDFLTGLYEGEGAKEPLDLVPDLAQGMSGKVQPEDDRPILPNTVVRSPIPGQYDLKDNRAISVFYEDPFFSDEYTFKTATLPNAVPPARVLKPGDFGNDKPWRPVIGMNTNRQSYASIAPPGHRMINHYTNDRHQQGYSRQSAGPRSSYNDRRQSYPPYQQRGSSYGGGSYQYNQRSAGYGNSSYGNSYHGNQSPYQDNYRNQSYQGNRNQYNQGSYGYQSNRSQSSLLGPGPSYGGQSRYQGQGQQQRQQHPTGRGNRGHNYPLSGNRYKPY